MSGLKGLKGSGSKVTRKPLPPHAGHPSNTAKEHPVFSFQYLQPGFTANDSSAEGCRLLINQLCAVSQLCWQDWEKAPHRGMGLEKLPAKQLKVSTACLPSDIDQVHIFRINQRARAIGYRQGRLFYLLWLDWHHDAYLG